MTCSGYYTSIGIKNIQSRSFLGGHGLHLALCAGGGLGSVKLAWLLERPITIFSTLVESWAYPFCNVHSEA